MERGRIFLTSTLLLGICCFARPSEKIFTTSSSIKGVAHGTSGVFSVNSLENIAKETERYLQSFGLLDAQNQIPILRVHIRYADSSNFTGKPLYVGLRKCYLHPLALKKLEKAAALLSREHPHLRLLIWDCARPLHIQKYLWKKAPVPGTEKWKYLSNPTRGSLHNYGLALDLTLADSLGQPLDMGTDFDHFGVEAHPIMEEALHQSGKLSDVVLTRRRLLRRIMQAAGFNAIPHEWWHFNAVSRSTAETHFTLLP
jgi:D-alanyl-D-alanine dipeptidase